MKLIRRDDYLDALTDVMGTPDIKVITGIRRSGKSKLLEALKTYIIAEIPNANIIHINYNLDEFEGLLDYHALLDYVKGSYASSKQNFVLIDEVQMCNGFERAVNSLHASEKYDIYITGSNAFLLSSDLATLFTGRTFEIEVYPFSFSEYLRYFEFEDTDAAFDGYTLEGGMSGSYVYGAPERKYKYIECVFETLVLRDIRNKYKLRDLATLTKLCNFMMDNISNLTSARNIAEELGRNGITTSYKTVSSYMQHLCSAFAFYKVQRYDIRGKKNLASGEKYYLCDHSFKYARLGTRNLDYGRTYENMVAIELMRRGYEVYAGVLYKKEIDFVAMRRDEKLYIQVSDDISNPDTFRREYEPLLQIRDAYPKLILSRTRHDMYTYEGIEVFDLARWLANSQLS